MNSFELENVLDFKNCSRCHFLFLSRIPPSAFIYVTPPRFRAQNPSMHYEFGKDASLRPSSNLYICNLRMEIFEIGKWVGFKFLLNSFSFFLARRRPVLM